MSTKTVIKNMDTNLSDHYPIRTTIASSFIKQSQGQKDIGILPRINWSKVDKNRYSDLVSKQIDLLKITSDQKPNNY